MSSSSTSADGSFSSHESFKAIFLFCAIVGCATITSLSKFHIKKLLALYQILLILNDHWPLTSWHWFSSCIFSILFMHSTLSGNTCTGTHAEVPPGASPVDVAQVDASSYTPASGGRTGEAYTLGCAAGFYPSQETGSILCDNTGVWLQKPTCMGECVTVLLIGDKKACE